MSAVPVFLRTVAEQVMRGAYAKAADAMPPGLDVADYVIILLDWDGKVSKTYNARKISHAPLLTLIDGDGIVRGVHQGGDLTAAALTMLEGVLPPPKRSRSVTAKGDWAGRRRQGSCMSFFVAAGSSSIECAPLPTTWSPARSSSA
jgi:hypothetical protein